MSFRNLFCAVALLACLNPNNLHAEEDQWYTKWKVQSSDPFLFRQVYRSPLFPNASYGLEGASADYLFVPQTRQVLNQEYVVAEFVLSTAAVAENYRNYFETWSKPYSVPTELQAALAAIAEFVPSAKAATLATTTLDMFFHVIESPDLRRKAVAIADTIDVGGVFREVSTVATDAQTGHNFMNVSIVYDVKVGSTQRRTILSTTTYAVHLVDGGSGAKPNPPTGLTAVVY